MSQGTLLIDRYTAPLRRRYDACFMYDALICTLHNELRTMLTIQCVTSDVGKKVVPAGGLELPT